MAYDEGLAERLREVFPEHAGIAEKKMFGGLCFLLDDKMLVGIMGSSLIARLGPDEAAKALQETDVREFDATGRPMKGWVVVEPDGLDTDQQLQSWLERAIRFVEALPTKPDSDSPQRRNVAEMKTKVKRKKGERGT